MRPKVGILGNILIWNGYLVVIFQFASERRKNSLLENWNQGSFEDAIKNLEGFVHFGRSYAFERSAVNFFYQKWDSNRPGRSEQQVLSWNYTLVHRPKRNNFSCQKRPLIQTGRGQNGSKDEYQGFRQK
jgi:hypothetical protein